MSDVARARASRLGGFAAAAPAGALVALAGALLALAGALLALAGALVAGLIAAQPAGATPTRTTDTAGPAAAVQPTAAGRAPADHVGILISGVGAYCLKWHSGMTGDEVLNAVARVNYRSDGVIVQIDGAPASGTADDTHFWSYWHDTGSRWQYSRIGEGGYTPAAGEVEGWSFDDGARNPPPPARRPQGLYAALCSGAHPAGDAASTAADAATSPPAAAAASAGGSPAPTLLAVGLVAILLGCGGWAAARRRRAR